MGDYPRRQLFATYRRNQQTDQSCCNALVDNDANLVPHEQAIFIASTAPAASAFSRIDIFAHESRVRRRIAAAVLAHPTTAV